jgi:hypothetical protein
LKRIDFNPTKDWKLSYQQLQAQDAKEYSFEEGPQDLSEKNSLKYH